LKKEKPKPISIPIDPSAVVIVMAYVLGVLAVCLCCVGMKRLLNIIE